MINIKGFLIYENEQEFKNSKNTAKNLDNNIQVGDYWLTNNGYYVPVIKRIDLKDTTNCYSIRITSPNIAPFRILTNKQTNISTYGKLRNFNRTIERVQKRNLMLQDRLFLDYLEAGMDIFEAAQLCYHKAKQPLKMTLQKVHNLMEQDVFKETIRSAKFMSNLHEKFESNGITKDWIAQQLKGIVENPAESHQLKIFALDNIIKTAKEGDAPANLAKQISKSKEMSDDEHKRIANVIGAN